MIIRPAVTADLSEIIEIYNLDPLTGQHEDVSDHLPAYYYAAFARIAEDRNQALLVAEIDSRVVGSTQVTFIQHLILKAFRRAIVEAVFIHPSYQGRGIGAALMKYVIQLAAENGCSSVELTSNKARARAHSFYERLGFKATHEGFKLGVEPIV